MGDPSDPLSLNRYVYCGLDPVNYVDPTGFMATEAAAIGLWELNAIPVWGTVAYLGIVGAAAVTEYGPMFAQLFEMGGNAAQMNGGNSADPGGLDPNKFKFSKHALERMEQRGISNSTVSKVLKNESFQYYHDDVWKTGYYDSKLKVFVGVVDNTVTTVINNVKPQYIENLMEMVP